MRANHLSSLRIQRRESLFPGHKDQVDLQNNRCEELVGPCLRHIGTHAGFTHSDLLEHYTCKVVVGQEGVTIVLSLL